MLSASGPPAPDRGQRLLVQHRWGCRPGGGGRVGAARALAKPDETACVELDVMRRGGGAAAGMQSVISPLRQGGEQRRHVEALQRDGVQPGGQLRPGQAGPYSSVDHMRTA